MLAEVKEAGIEGERPPDVAEGATGVELNRHVVGGKTRGDTPLLVEGRVEDKLLIEALVATAQDTDLGAVETLDTGFYGAYLKGVVAILRKRGNVGNGGLAVRVRRRGERHLAAIGVIHEHDARDGVAVLGLGHDIAGVLIVDDDVTVVVRGGAAHGRGIEAFVALDLDVRLSGDLIGDDDVGIGIARDGVGTVLVRRERRGAVHYRDDVEVLDLLDGEGLGRAIVDVVAGGDGAVDERPAVGASSSAKRRGPVALQVKAAAVYVFSLPIAVLHRVRSVGQRRVRHLVAERPVGPDNRLVAVKHDLVARDVLTEGVVEIIAQLFLGQLRVIAQRLGRLRVNEAARVLIGGDREILADGVALRLGLIVRRGGVLANGRRKRILLALINARGLLAIRRGNLFIGGIRGALRGLHPLLGRGNLSINRIGDRRGGYLPDDHRERHTRGNGPV